MLISGAGPVFVWSCAPHFVIQPCEERPERQNGCIQPAGWTAMVPGCW